MQEGITCDFGSYSFSGGGKLFSPSTTSTLSPQEYIPWAMMMRVVPERWWSSGLGTPGPDMPRVYPANSALFFFMGEIKY